MARSQVVSVWICLALLLAPMMAAGQTNTPEDRFNHAVDLAKSGDCQQAVEITLEVLPQLPLVNRTGAYKLLGYSFRKLNMLPEAWHYLSQYLQVAAREDATIGQWLKEVEVLLREKHIKVTLNSDPQGATVQLNSSKTASLASSLQCPATWWFLPGDHEVVFAKDGYAERPLAVTVKDFGDKGVRQVKLQSLGTKPKQEDGGGFSRWPEWTFIGAGVALGIGGATSHVLGSMKNESLHDKYWDRKVYPNAVAGKALYDEEFDSDVAPKLKMAYVLYGTGAASIIAGVVTWAVRKPPARDSSAWNLAPWSLPDGGGAVFTLGW
jgi:hypothetical protein